MNYESLADGGFATGTMMGSGGFIVLDEDQCIVEHTMTLARFYNHESCGQCTPCREGTGWMYKILKKIEKGEGKWKISICFGTSREKSKEIPFVRWVMQQPGRLQQRSVTSEMNLSGTKNPELSQTQNYGLAHYADPIPAVEKNAR
jgi:NADH-quinone oxidoreductase subunit F